MFAAGTHPACGSRPEPAIGYRAGSRAAFSPPRKTTPLVDLVMMHGKRTCTAMRYAGMSMAIDRDLAIEIATAEEGLRRAFAEVASRLSAGRHDADTSDLVQHCGELADVLTAAVAQLEPGPEADAMRQLAASMAADAALFEREYRRRDVH